jgi:hypothetical protein
MSKLDEREYVVHEKRSLVPTPLGMMLIKLVDRTAEKCRDGAGVDLFDVGFTAEMEEKLDRVELGKVEWRAMLEEFYPGLLGWIEDARETADPETVQQLLEALRHVGNWDPPVKRGRRTYDDAETVADLRRETAEGKKLSGAQGRMLHALACRYMDQIPAEFVNKLELKPLEAPRDETASKLNLLAGVECEAPRKVGKRTYDDRKFIKSLQRQVDSRKRLSEKQVAALDRLLLKYADQIEDFERHKKEWRLADPVVESDPNLKEILGLMDAVDAWNPPKGKFDDRKFFESLRSQFDARGGLSPRQTAALKKMVRRYADQIPNYAQKAEQLDLPAGR